MNPDRRKECKVLKALICNRKQQNLKIQSLIAGNLGSDSETKTHRAKLFVM